MVRKKARAEVFDGSTGSFTARVGAPPGLEAIATAAVAAEVAAATTAAPPTAAYQSPDDNAGDPMFEPEPLFMAREWRTGGAGVELFLDPQQSPLLSVSSDGHEGHFAIAYQQQNQYHQRQISFGFIALRFVQFSDQCLLVSWCKDCPCGNSSATDDFFQDRSMAQVSSSAFFGQRPPALCFAAQKLLESWGDDLEAMKATFLRVMRGPQPFPCIVSVTGFSTAYSAVRTGLPFRTWGLVKSPKGQLRMCLTCVSHRRQCSHVTALPKLQIGDSDPAIAWERGFRRQFHLLDGQRKLSCISRNKIPEAPEHDPHVLATITSRCEGKQAVGEDVPGESFTASMIPIDQLHQHCQKCGCTAWGQQQLPDETCDVFLLGALVKVKWAYSLCSTTQCKGKLTPDGSEFAILRYHTD